MQKSYNNFVRPCSSLQQIERQTTVKLLSGEEAKKIYLDEVSFTGGGSNKCKDKQKDAFRDFKECQTTTRVSYDRTSTEISDKDLFQLVQNDDIDKLKQTLDSFPDKINLLDGYGWSLLMIACQANSKNAVIELLKRGIDMSVRDKAGNSAQSLIIKNKNYELADIFLSCRNRKDDDDNTKVLCSKGEVAEFFCDICNLKVTTDRQFHVSSTIHNINLSKGKKITPNYVIPETNKGFQIMLKVGWNKESGLGPDGSGTKYPLKTVQKKDRKGLGHDKNVIEANEKKEKFKNRRTILNDYAKNKRMEINFRRQFY